MTSDWSANTIYGHKYWLKRENCSISCSLLDLASHFYENMKREYSKLKPVICFLCAVVSFSTLLHYHKFNIRAGFDLSVSPFHKGTMREEQSENGISSCFVLFHKKIKKITHKKKKIKVVYELFTYNKVE